MMKLRYLAALALTLAVGAAAQNVTLPTGCSTVAANNVAKSIDRVKLAADIACLDRALPLADAQIASARKARADRLAAITPAPTPTATPSPPPTARSSVVAEGDSISIKWAGSYPGAFENTHPGVVVHGTAVGGSGLIEVMARFPSDAGFKPKVVTLLIGANGLGTATPQEWLNALWQYTAMWKATGAKVAVATILPLNVAAKPDFTASLMAARKIINPAIRAAVGTKIDAVIDFAADPAMGADDAPLNANLYSDGVHPTDDRANSGQVYLLAVYTPVVEALLADSPAPSAELPPIASGIDVGKYLVPSWGTGAIPPHEEDVGAFRFLCAPAYNKYDDPIVYPGQPGKSHLHTFFGNTLADANSTYVSLRTTGESTCNNKLNRSAYWVASMMTAAGKVVMPDYLAVYYKRLPSTDARCRTAATACVPLPRGLRYVFGYNMLDPSKSSPALSTRWWNCDGPGAVEGHFATIAEALKGCPVGDRLGMVVIAPNCWNGKDLDSADHRSHMAYQFYDGTRPDPVCPKTHPYIIPTFQLGAWYSTDANAKDWYLSSDRMPGMPAMEPGSTAHADWFGAWEDSILALWTANCIEKLLSCNGGDLGNGQQIRGLADYVIPTKTVLVDPPAR